MQPPEAVPGVSLSPGNPRIRELIALALCPCPHRDKYYQKDDLPDPSFPHAQFPTLKILLSSISEEVTIPLTDT